MRNINLVWRIEKEDGAWALNFKDIVVEEVNYFSSMFKEYS
jgi:hypothetical protein